MSDDALLDELLGEARSEIDSIDDEILKLLERRAKVVARVGEVKKAHNLPVFHPAREEDLIYNRRKEADKLSLSPEMVEDIFRTVMRASRIKQTKTMAQKSVRPGAKILVVGGAGSMGRLIYGWFSAAGYDARILETDDWGNVGEKAEGVDLAILSVPIHITGEVAERLSPHLSPDAILADITSTKSEPMERMLRAHPGPVLGLHPMFGPTTDSLDKQIVVVSPGRNPEGCKWVVEQLTAWGAVTVAATAKEHDEVMDVVQGLRHFATFAFGQFLSKRKISLQRTLEFSSPIYRLELDMVGRLFAQDPTLYADIIFSTPERLELLRGYVESLEENIRMLKEGDIDTFMEEFAKVAEWFGPFSDQAIRESSYLIEKMIERF